MAKLELALLVGAESKEFLADLTTQLDRMEKLSGKTPKGKVQKETEVEDEEEDFAPKAKKSKKAKAVDFDEEEDEESEDEDEDEAEASEDEDEEEEDEISVSKLKKGKAVKITSDDVNDAAKECAVANNRAHVLGILKKKFKVKSISDLEPSQYADVIKALKV